ncbi:MAG TPA: flagellar hook-associated protein FlgK [Castellaniella sp.]|uniref:flagellar hook-associated protein FlgK n=1 Tax=Castellaniella sp. TaxID=1955812 RepID=UPI002F0EB0F7
MNLANLGKAGLQVAQDRLQTTGHNINNAATPGYSRQAVIAQSAGATSTSAGWVGRGVVAVSVQRSYDTFLSQQLNDSQSRSAALTSYGNQIGQINNLVADRTVGISPAIQKFFDSLDAVASAPADVAARQDLIGQANSLSTQIRNANAFLDSQRQNVNTQVSTTVSQINSYLSRIQDVNKQLATAGATTPGQPPNDLLDQRDQLVNELGQLVDIKTYAQGDQISITTGNGQTLLGGNTVFPLQAQPSVADPGRLAISYTMTGADGQLQTVEMPEGAITGGQLGGLLKFRADALDSVQNDLGRIALGISVAVNQQHTQGVDLSGAQGGALFDVGTPTVIDNARNVSQGAPKASYTPGGLSQITDQDYRVQYDGSGYVVTQMPSGTAVAPVVDATAHTLSFDGVTLDVTGLAPVAGDTWTVQPTRNAAQHMDVLITDPSKIAAAASGAGTANGDNALKLAALRTDKVLGNGSMGLNEAYSQLVNNVAVKTQQNTTAQKAQDTLVQQNTAAQQGVSGVNLDEEYINLQQYQEQYQAAARLINTASTLFDTLLGLRS